MCINVDLEPLKTTCRGSSEDGFKAVMLLQWQKELGLSRTTEKHMSLEFLGCRQISQIFFYSLKNNDNLSLIFQVVTLLFRYESRIVINHIA